MEGREQNNIRSMSGQEVADFFGDRSLLKLEADHKQFEKEMEELKEKIVAMQEDPESDWEDIHTLELELQTKRDKMREQFQLIRKMAMDFALKRG